MSSKKVNAHVALKKVYSTAMVHLEWKQHSLWHPQCHKDIKMFIHYLLFLWYTLILIFIFSLSSTTEELFLLTIRNTFLCISPRRKETASQSSVTDGRYCEWSFYPWCRRRQMRTQGSKLWLPPGWAWFQIWNELTNRPKEGTKDNNIEHLWYDVDLRFSKHFFTLE